MRPLRTISFLLVAVVFTLPSASAESWTLPRDSTVWARWNPLHPANLSDQSTKTLSVRAGTNASTFVNVVNDGDSDISDVTLTVSTRGTPVAIDLSQTFAGDSPQYSYAWWPSVKAHAGGLVTAWVLGTTPGTFQAESVITFIRGGVREVSINAIRGTIEADSRPLPLDASLILGAFLIAGASARARTYPLRRDK